MYKARVEINHEGQWLNLTTVLVNDDFGMSSQWILLNFYHFQIFEFFNFIKQY